MVLELNDRSREVFRQIVEAYMETGEPVGSRTLARLLTQRLSPATIRNVMADLEEAGLLFAPHTSAGRLPTEAGLRLYVDGILEVGDLSAAERHAIERQCAGSGRSVEELLAQASQALSGLAHAAGLVVAPKTQSPLRHIEFVALNPGRVLVVMVTETGVVENRVVEMPADIPASALVQAGNFLNARVAGRTLIEAAEIIRRELASDRAHLDTLASRVVEAGVASWAGEGAQGSLIVRGQAHLLEDVSALADLERIRLLFAALETKETMLRLVSLADGADGVQIFIGADNQLFGMAGCSMIVSPYRDSRRSIVGAIGVIGPTRMNYARIIPMVDYTAQLVGRLIG
jgi:heat-inducible transcriptional repressor